MTAREILAALFILKYLCLVAVVYYSAAIICKVGGLREWR